MKKQIIITLNDHLDEKFQPIDLENIKANVEAVLEEDYDVTVLSVEIKEDLDGPADIPKS